MKRISVLAISVSALALAACERPPMDPAAAGGVNLAAISGGGAGEICTELAAPLVVQATRNGRPIKGQLVNFVVTQGGGRMWAGSATTDGNGYARDYWTYGATPGPQAVEVRVVDPTSGNKIVHGSFTGTAARVGHLSPIFVGLERYEDAIDTHLAATLRDGCGIGMAGEYTYFQVPGQERLVITDANGLASAMHFGLRGNTRYTVTVEWHSGFPGDPGSTLLASRDTTFTTPPLLPVVY